MIFKSTWESPSNIAIIKYWGKYGNQLPQNPSISFTLNNAKSITEVEYSPNEAAEVLFLFEGKNNKAFSERIKKVIEGFSREKLPYLKNGRIKISSENTFPHSSGIASSASAMSALAMCLCDIEGQIEGKNVFDSKFYKKGSELSRLGSGSACRSIYPKIALWGKTEGVEESSNDYAIGMGESIHPIFEDFQDDILIISPHEKSVSSSAGHGLMIGNPYAPARYKHANDRMNLLLLAMKTGDLEAFGKIAEEEALTLHALMMCSDPSYILMEPNTLQVIKHIQNYRKETTLPVYFTLDAGPNVHVLYPQSAKSQFLNFRNEVLKPLCHNGKIIEDFVGEGSKKLDNY